MSDFEYMLDELGELCDERLSEWERQFLDDMSTDDYVAEYGPTPAQEDKVREIYDREVGR